MSVKKVVVIALIILATAAGAKVREVQAIDLKTGIKIEKTKKRRVQDWAEKYNNQGNRSSNENSRSQSYQRKNEPRDNPVVSVKEELITPQKSELQIDQNRLLAKTGGISLERYQSNVLPYFRPEIPLMNERSFSAIQPEIPNPYIMNSIANNDRMMGFNALAYQREIENMFVKPLPPPIPLIPIEPKESRNELRDLRETLAAKKIEAPISDTNRTEQEHKKRDNFTFETRRDDRSYFESSSTGINRNRSNDKKEIWTDKKNASRFYTSIQDRIPAQK